MSEPLTRAELMEQLKAELYPWVVTHHHGCHEPADEDWGSSLSTKEPKDLALGCPSRGKPEAPGLTKTGSRKAPQHQHRKTPPKGNTTMTSPTILDEIHRWASRRPIAASSSGRSVSLTRGRSAHMAARKLLAPDGLFYACDYVDLFAGPGGWDAAARALGLDGVGIELDPSACETRRAAGLRTVQGSVLDHRPRAFRARGLIASPPCQTFSTAGSGVGRQALDSVLALADVVAQGVNPSELGWDGDPRTVLVLEPLWWAVQAMAEGHPYRWIALEQVPPVLPVWERLAVHLRAMGYAVAVGVLNAEAYGVPQTRRRAVLVARLGQPVALPTHTHSRYYPRTPDKLDPGVPRWVSMAEALGFEAGRWVMRSNYGTGGNPRNRGERGDEPAATVTSKAGRNQWQAMDNGNFRFVTLEGETPPVYVNGNQANAARRSADEPAPTVHFGARQNDVRWADEPAPTIAGDPRVAPRGCKHPGPGCCSAYPGTPGRQFGPASRRVTVEEAAALQTFPTDWPWRGTKTKRYEQVGNAIPPQLAWHILGAVAL